MTKRQEQALKTRQKILDAASELLLKNEFDELNIDDITNHCGVAKGTFYTYFPSKQDIFTDLYAAADDLFVNKVAKELKGKTVCDKIVDYFRYYAKLNIDSGIETMKVMYNSENTWFTRKRPMHGVLTELIEEGQKNGELIKDADAQEMNFFLYTMARGCCYNWCIRDGHYNLEAQMSDFIKRALISYRADR